MDGSAAPDAVAPDAAEHPYRGGLHTASGLSRTAPPAVVVLLSTWNGAGFIGPQLDSIAAQAEATWQLFWRDDGSDDDTAGRVRRFAAGVTGPDGLVPRCTEVSEPAGRLGVTQSFLLLLRTAVAAAPITRCFSFADQDDVWLPDKLARGAGALEAAGSQPALYCARQLLVDAELNRQSLSLPVRRQPGFPAALTQNIATGCTVMLNRAAAELVCRSAPPPLTIHDWWCYLLVSAAGGVVLFDDQPAVLYRQHAGNAVGAPSWWGRRAFDALRRGPSHFMAVFRGHLAALQAQPALLTPENRGRVADLQAALSHGPLQRLACLRMQGLRRQTWQETLLFFWWFLRG